MYARVTTYKLTEEGASKLHEIDAKISPAVMALPGIKHWSSFLGEDREAMVVAIYESEDHANAAAEKVKALWGSTMQYIDGAPNPAGYDVYGYETR